MILNNINGKMYIGYSKNPIGRYNSHKSVARKKPNRPLYNAMNKYGFDNFSLVILADYETEEWALEAEVFFIEAIGTQNREIGYNIDKGGTTGKTHSAESIKKMSKPRSYKWKLTEETKLKQSLSKKGVKKSEEHKEKIRKINLGKKASDETKQKMSQKRKGKTWKLIDGKRVWL